MQNVQGGIIMGFAFVFLELTNNGIIEKIVWNHEGVESD